MCTYQLGSFPNHSAVDFPKASDKTPNSHKAPQTATREHKDFAKRNNLSFHHFPLEEEI